MCSAAALYIALWLSDASGELGSASRSQKNEIMQMVAPQAGGHYNARQAGVELLAKVVPLLPSNTNPLALGALGPPHAI